ncbi:MAG TPA: hypothetical protein VFG11_08330, partial [Acidobacteriota bacterium]|nr:hypothetical protein [Acidobacteriota bacterium]
MLHTIIYSTLGELATGILLFIAIVPPSQIGKGFGRFHSLLALALWLIACWGSFGTAFWMFTASVLLTAAFSQKDILYYPFLATSILLSFYLLARPELNSYGLGYALLVHVPAILVLGAGAVSMLLGHWYLVSPKLSIRYLKIMT